MDNVGATEILGLNAKLIMAFSVLTAVVTEVGPYDPIVVFIPVVTEIPPPFPEFLVMSSISVISLRSGFDCPEYCVEPLASGRAVPIIATTRESALVVVAPGIEALVSAVDSILPIFTPIGLSGSTLRNAKTSAI